MASELKSWRYEIKYGPEGEDAYSWVYDDHGAMVATMKTHKAKQIVDAMNTRPAPAATDTGLETVGWIWEYAQYSTDDRGYYGYETVITESNPTDHVSPAEKLRNVRELVTRQNAEAVIAAKEAERAEQWRLRREMEADRDTQKAIATSLETQLAAATDLISRAQEIIPDSYINWHDFARAVLGGKPS